MSINYIELDINPFARTEINTSYYDNIGRLYPAIDVEDFTGSIEVIDGQIIVNGKLIPLDDKTIGDLHLILKDLGVKNKIFRGFENIDAIMLVNFSNKDIVSTEIDRSPIDAGLIKSKNLINNIYDDYYNNVDVSFSRKDGMVLKNEKVYLDSNYLGEDLISYHHAKNFFLNITDLNIIRNFSSISKNNNVINSLINKNILIKGNDNAGYKI